MNSIQLKKQVLFPLLGGLLILLSLLVILGWIFGITWLTDISPGYPTMKFNTALAFGFTGAATLLIYRIDKKGIRYFYYAFATLVLLTGLLTLSEFISGIHLGIDNLFITDRWPVSVTNPHPGRMACGSALSFSLLGIAFFGMVSPVKWFRHVAQYGLHVVATIGYIAFLGYLFNVGPSQVFSPFISIALHTSISFILISFGLAFYNADMGLTGLFTGKRIGNIMVRRIFPVLVIVAFILGYLRIRLFPFHILSVEFGVALSATVYLVVMLLLLWRTSLQVNKLEERKLQTEEANYKLNLDIAAAEKARRETEEINKRNLLFVQQAPSPIAMFDTEMRYLAASEQWIKDYRLQGKEIIGHSHYEVFPEIGEDWKSIHQKCLHGAIDKCDEFYFVRADGTGQWISWDVRPWYDAQGKIGGLLMYTADISHHKKNENLLKEATDSLAEAQQIAHVGSWVWELPGKELRWSDELYNIYGLQPGAEPASVDLFLRVLHPEDKDRVNAELNTAIRHLMPIKTEFRVVRPDGSVRYIDARGEVFWGENGRAVKVIGTLTDLTERKKLEREKEEIYKRNLLFVEQAPSAIAMCDNNMVYMAVSQQWIKDYKLQNTQVIGRLFYDVTPGLPAGTIALHQHCLQGNSSKSDGRYFTWPDGRGQWIAWDIRPWYDATGNIGGLLIYTFDVTSVKEKEREIQETTERLAEAQQIAHIGSWEWNILTGETKWSDELYRIAGLQPGAVKPHKGFFAGITNAEGAQKLKASTEEILAGQPTSDVQLTITRPDGTQREIETRAKVFFNHEGKPVRVLSTVADITERKKNESLIQETTERLAEAQQIAHVGSWDWDITAGKMTWSDEQYRIYGFEPGSVDPNSGLFYNMLHPDDKHRVIAALGDALNGTRPYATEFRLVLACGRVRNVDARGRVLRNNNGQPVRFIGTLADITERKTKEAIIEEATGRLAEAQQIAHVGSWEWDLATDELKWSDEHYRIFGFQVGAVVPSAQLIFSMLHPGDREKMIIAGKVRQTGEPYVHEFRIIRADGKVKDIEARGKAIRNSEGKPVRMVGTSADITERKKLERELAHSEKEFRSSFENSAIGMAFTSLAGSFIKVNARLAHMVGYTQTELLNMTFMDITHPDSISDNVYHMHQLKTGAIDKYETEKKYIHKNGSTVWVNLTVSVVFDGQQPLYMISQMTDITGRKKIESDLHKVNTELKSIFDAETHVSIIGSDMDGVITHFSRGAEILLGYKAAEMTGLHTPAFIHDRAEIKLRGYELTQQLGREIKGMQVFSAFAESRNFESREWTYVRKDGTRLPVQLVVCPTKDENGNINGYLGIATDITERKNAEEVHKNIAVLQSRNKEMEEFAYIASHDLQEPLRTVSSFITILTAEYGGHLPPEAQEYLEFITASTTRMRELIKGLLEYSRLGQRKTFVEVDCNKVIKEVTADLGEAIKESNAVLIIDELPVINALSTEIHQLFQNLLSNAIKFRKKGVQPHVHVTAKALPGYWQFSVSDNGVGIDARHFLKIFILFQRLHNRRDYAGTGIGLSYCKKIVELHHGRIWVESVPGQGSQFFFTISNHLA